MLFSFFSYFSAARNGFPPPLDSRFKSSTFPNLLSTLPTANKDDTTKKAPDYTSILNPFANSSMFPPLIDMSTTQTLLAMVRSAKEAELQGLLKNVKRTDVSSPLDLSAAAPPLKRSRVKAPSTGSPGANPPAKRAESESPRLHEDVSSWTVDDVCNFVSSIDICAEYVQVSEDHHEKFILLRFPVSVDKARALQHKWRANYEAFMISVWFYGEISPAVKGWLGECT